MTDMRRWWKRRAGTSVLAGLALLLCHVALLCHAGTAHDRSGHGSAHHREVSTVVTDPHPVSAAGGSVVAPAQVATDDGGPLLLPGAVLVVLCLVALGRWLRVRRRPTLPLGTISLRQPRIRPPPLPARSLPVLTLVCVSRT